LAYAFYGFKANEILENNPFLDLEVDPKSCVAKHHAFPVIIQHAPLEMIARSRNWCKSAHKIVCTFSKSIDGTPRKIGVSVNRAKYFISVSNENTHLKF
jgi:predicted DNA-binding helix-hairpin-helix protein